MSVPSKQKTEKRNRKRRQFEKVRNMVDNGQLRCVPQADNRFYPFRLPSYLKPAKRDRV